MWLRRRRTVRTNQRRQRNWRGELFEDRTLLTAVVPNNLAPSLLDSARQTLFPVGAIQESFPAPDPAGAAFYSFSADSNGQAATVLFAVSNDFTLDTALGIYDSSGNLIEGVNQSEFPFQVTEEQLTFQTTPDESYVLGVFYDTKPTFPPPGTLWFSATTSAKVNSTILNASHEGFTEFRPPIGNDTFSSSRDADFFPLEFLNATDQASLIIASPGGEVFSELYFESHDGNWERIAPTSVDPLVTFYQLASQTGRGLDEDRYQLAIAPAAFEAAAVPVLIDVVSAPAGRGDVPASVSPDDVFVPLSEFIGSAFVSEDRELGDDLGLDADYFAFESRTDGIVRLEVFSSDFTPVISVYDSATREVRQVRYADASAAVLETRCRTR